MVSYFRILEWLIVLHDKVTLLIILIKNFGVGNIIIVTVDSNSCLLYTSSRTLGENDEYLEVFDENMQYSETPVVNSISEKLCDIYQDLKNFISAYRSGMIDVIEEALWQLNNSFELYWGKACASVLRAIHLACLLYTSRCV